jgi:ribosomal protein S26
MGVAKWMVTQMLNFITQMLSTIIPLIIRNLREIIVENRKYRLITVIRMLQNCVSCALYFVHAVYLLRKRLH